MTLWQKWSLFLLFALFACPVWGEESIYFRRFGVEEGLAQNTVNCILQDRQGFMWFGTKDGLSRYDGCRFLNFKYDKKDSNSIGNSFIRSLYQDQNDLIWIGTDAGVYTYNPRTETFNAFDTQTDTGIRIEKEVNDIKPDRKGNLWFAVDWQGVFFYDIQNSQLTFYKLNTIVNAWNICIDREDKVWIGTHGGGLNCFNPQEQQFETIPLLKNHETNAPNDIYSVFQDNYNDILIGTANNGVKRLSLVDKQVHSFLEADNHHPLFVRDIIRRSDNEIWIGTESGIYIFDTQKKKVRNLRHHHVDPYSLSDNAVYSMYQDREGGIWIGTYFGGVNYYPHQYNPFEKFYPLNDGQTIRGKRVREFQQDKYGNIWIGTEDEGLNCYNPASGMIENLFPDESPGSISYNNIHGLLADDDKLWVGTFGHGLDILDIKTKKVIRHYRKTKDPESLCDNSVFSIFKDHSNQIWIGTIYGLATYNPEQDNFTKIAQIGDIFIYDILQTYDGMIWIATFGKGLHRFNPRTEQWTIFQYDPENEKSLSHNKIISLFEDSRKILWITTEGGGICRYNRDEETFTSFSIENGLPNNVVYKVLEDNRHQLWFTTNRGLVCFHPDDNHLKIYTRSNGLLGDQFNYKSGLKDTNGKLYFGSLTGFIAFEPENFSQNSYVPPIYITDFLLFNKALKPGKENAPFAQSLIYTDEIHLAHNQSTFSIDFAALSYTAPEKNQYRYLLKGFDQNWNYLSSNQRVSYSNIPPGEYTFCVMASNSDGIWNQQARNLNIVIHPPFLQTGWAYLLYTTFSAGIILWLFISYKKRNNRKNKRKEELFENEKEKEIFDAKIAFFTNIAHEIRTPLTLIKGPLEHILKENVDENELKENLEVMERNTNRLLDLSNQLLDFRKTEREGFRLNYVHTNITQLIKGVHSRFHLTAQQRNLTFDLHLPALPLWADVDHEALTKILSNLFSNAIKYARTEISLTLNTDETAGTFLITVKNDGKAIPEEAQEKIFEPFYQIEDNEANHIRSGTGLGLPLARSLAKMHEGMLSLRVETGRHNAFLLKLPLKQDHSVDIKNTTQQNDTDNIFESEPVGGQRNMPVVLMVEDDTEMMQFLTNKLKNTYHILKANNGEEALKILDNERVSIVITDVMMPVINGLELCREIKSNFAYSHIPVIMLTARTGLQSKIEGLDAGADAYVEKPFSTEHLLAQLSNLLSNRIKVKEAFIQSPYLNPRSIALTKSDEDFLKKVTEIIHKNISETQFSVDSLADALNMSRSSFHRKIKGVSELTPNEFILLVKLKKAAEHLQEGLYKINEVCYVVGFSSPSYFSKCFKKQFGIAPKEFAKK